MGVQVSRVVSFVVRDMMVLLFTCYKVMYCNCISRGIWVYFLRDMLEGRAPKKRSTHMHACACLQNATAPTSPR